MSTSYLAAASLLFIGLAAHPFTTYPLSLYLMRKFGRGRPQTRIDRTGTGLSFAICMSVYNEESCIERKVVNLLELAATVERCSIHIYADAPSDRTVELLQPYADRIDLVLGRERRGKTCGLNLLMKRVEADVVLFTDANVIIDPAALQRMRPHFDDPKVGCVCGNLIYVNGDETPTSASGALYWRIEEAIKQLESDTFSVIGADGSLFAIRRECHRPPPDDIIDDFYVSMMILCNGYTVVREPAALAFERSATGSGEEFRRKVRIACQAFNVHRLVWPRLGYNPRLLYFYFSHRLLKWLMIYNIAIGGALMLWALATAFSPGSVTLLSVALALTMAALAACGSRLVQNGLAMLLACTGAGLGVWRSIRGDRFQVWQPALSPRNPVGD